MDIKIFQMFLVPKSNKKNFYSHFCESLQRCRPLLFSLLVHYLNNFQHALSTFDYFPAISLPRVVSVTAIEDESVVRNYLRID